MRHVIRVVGLLCLLWPTTPVRAQSTQPTTPKPAPTKAPLIFVSMDGAFQPGTDDFGAKSTFSLYDEQGSFETTQSIQKGVTADVTVLVRVWHDFLVGFGATGLNSSEGGTISTTVPHPLFFDQPRSASADVPSLPHRELAFLFMLGWKRTLADNLDAVISLGPVLFDVKQDVITGIEFSETAPTFSTIGIDTVNTQKVSERVGGFHLGGDVTYMLYKWIGAGGYMRWLGGGTVKASLPDGSSLELKPGGFQFGGGVRLRF
jgi:hypothetical protein